MAKEVSFTIKVDDKGTLKKVTMDAEQLGRAVRSVQDDSEKAKRSVLTGQKRLKLSMYYKALSENCRAW